tara:strand:- start:38 stop:523 length:486 start_codon:yes stop_codon:yes gene_type:complete
MNNIITIFLLVFANYSFAQIQLSWKDLEDVEFSDLYVQELDEYVLYPNYGMDVMALNGQEVILTGYVLEIDPSKGFYVLSKGPFASCFFCGKGGPETVAELVLKSNNDKFFMDEFASIKGKLILNPDDIYRCIYIIEDAERYNQPLRPRPEPEQIQHQLHE